MTSPFKLLDAYSAQDKKIFFGRDEEVNALYALSFQTRLLLFYGQSGTGKTSIIQCGLANKFKYTDWFPVFVRRKDNINTAFDAEIRRLAPTPIKPGVDIVKAINSLYLDFLRPITIIFDQFEELFILGEEAEQAAFFESVKAILASDLNCKIIISMREEYIAQLQSFEKIVPTLFDKRLRIEAMTPKNVQAVITGTVAAEGISLEHGDATAQHIVTKISDRRSGVQLAYLQVYLDRLFRKASTTSTPTVFSDALIAETGELGDVMALFLDEQSLAIENRLRASRPDLEPDAIQHLLEQMTTLDGTKLPIAKTDLTARLARLAPVLDDALAALVASRIVRDDDGSYELAHDALARRIADRRSADAKATLKIEALVRQGLGAPGDTPTYLSREKLALVMPAIGALNLSSAERAFVEESSARLRRRRRLAIGVTVAVIAVLAAFATYAQSERNKAIGAIGTARSTINDMSFTIVDQLQPIPKTQDIRRALLKKAEAVNNDLQHGGGKTDGIAHFWRNILEGDIFQERDDPPGAMREYLVALRLSRVAVGVAPSDTSWQRNLSVALGRIAALATAAGRDKDAAALYAEALKLDTSLADADPANVDSQRDLAISNFQFGAFERQRGRPASARPYLVKAAAITTRLLAADPDNRDLRNEWATTLISLGELERDERNFDAARAAFAKAETALAKLVAADPDRSDWRKSLVIDEYNLANVAKELKKWDAARNASAVALKQVMLLPDEDAEPLESNINRQRAKIERLSGQPAAARDYAERAIELLEIQLARDPKDKPKRQDKALVYRELGDIALAECNLDAARAAAQQSLALASGLSAEEPNDDGFVTNRYQAKEQIGIIEQRAGAVTAARQAAAAALDIARGLQTRIPLDKDLQIDIDRISRQIADLDHGLAAAQPENCRPARPTRSR